MVSNDILDCQICEFGWAYVTNAEFWVNADSSTWGKFLLAAVACDLKQLYQFLFCQCFVHWDKKYGSEASEQ